MSNVLHILASPRTESYSTRLAGAFFEAYRKLRPNDRVETLDVFRAEIPPFYAPAAKAKYAVGAGHTPRDEAEAAWRSMVEAINYFKRFDMYVVASPMWNFGVPYRLKQYIDVIVQPSLTFAVSPAGYRGLVTGRPMMLLLARGGVYQSGNPLETFDFQESYLRCISAGRRSTISFIAGGASRPRWRSALIWLSGEGRIRGSVYRLRMTLRKPGRSRGDQG